MAIFKMISTILVISQFAVLSFAKSNDKKNAQVDKKYVNSNFQSSEEKQKSNLSKKERVHHTYQAARPAAENKVEDTGAK